MISRNGGLRRTDPRHAQLVTVHLMKANQMERETMARAAGCYSEAGVIATAKTIKAFMVEKGIPYYNAAGQVMVVRDEIWREDEHVAFHEAFVELYGEEEA